MPLFPELRPYLEAVFDEAEPKAAEIRHHPLPRRELESADAILRIISWPGLKPWPKLFQNLRSTRETELAEQFPIHVVCEWIGNSQAVAAKHYLQMTDDHLRRRQVSQQGQLQNPVQSAAETARNAPSAETADCSNYRWLRCIAYLYGCTSDPDGTRTRVTGVKGRCPRPLDDGATCAYIDSMHANTGTAWVLVAISWQVKCWATTASTDGTEQIDDLLAERVTATKRQARGRQLRRQK